MVSSLKTTPNPLKTVNLEDPKPESSPKTPPKAKQPPPEPNPTVEAVEAEVMDTDVSTSPNVKPLSPPKYTLWEKVMPPAKRGKQIATMEEGSREVLSLVRSIRENMDRQVSTQNQLMETLTILPEAVDSVKQLADYTGQHAEMLKLMQESHSHMGETVNRFNDTLVSMDKTTQLILERAQRSEAQLSKMLRRSQRRLALVLIMMVLIFLGTSFAIVYSLNPDRTEAWLAERNLLVSNSHAPGHQEPADALPEDDPVSPPELSPEAPSPLLPSETTVEEADTLSPEDPLDSPEEVAAPPEAVEPDEDVIQEPETDEPVEEPVSDEGEPDLTENTQPLE